MPKDSWPKKLRSEWNVFERYALNGLKQDHDLAVAAREYEFSVQILSVLTIKKYEKAIERALGVIQHDDRLGILDLIKVTKRRGEKTVLYSKKNHNHLVDIYRKIEQDKIGLVKSAGFDSAAFENFTQAVKAVAARNGHGRLIKAFNEAYVLCTDEEATERRKCEKKLGLSLEWVDKQIDILHPKVIKIINSGSFKRTPGRIKKADRDIMLVLFYIRFATLRYMGYRQQCLVNCLIGTNFILNDDGTVVLHYDKTKNGKRLHMELNENRQETHGRLWEVMVLYYKKVYPYLVRRSGDTLGGQLFVTSDGHTGSFRVFDNHTDFDTMFKVGRDQFLNTKELESKMRSRLHPHFMRGLCTDWMITVLHMSFDQAAEVLGDDVKTVKEKYVDQNRVYYAGAAFDMPNAILRAAKIETESQLRLESAVIRIERASQAILSAKEQEISELRLARERDALEIARLKKQIVVFQASINNAHNQMPL